MKRPIAGLLLLFAATPAPAQNRGVYPLGMSATQSGLTPAPGFTYANQLLFYSRDHARDDDGHRLPAEGDNDVLMDMNTFVWVSRKTFLGGAHYSAAATLPFAKNSLDSDINGKISGGSGFADSYYMPVILGWNRDRFGVRAIYGFLAPTGRFNADATDNVGSGYWTHAFSSGQTLFLDSAKRFTFSSFEMYEFHTKQDQTETHPGQTFDLDFSLLGALPATDGWRLELGPAGYFQRQTTATTGPSISASASDDRYAVNALGGALSVGFPQRKGSAGLKYFKEFSNRSTFQGYSLQLSGSIYLSN